MHPNELGITAAPLARCDGKATAESWCAEGTGGGNGDGVVPSTLAAIAAVRAKMSVDTADGSDATGVSAAYPAAEELQVVAPRAVD